MMSLFKHYVQRIYLWRTVIFLGGILLCNGLLFIGFGRFFSDMPSIMSQADLYRELYVFETMFMLRLSVLVWLALLVYELFDRPAQDLVLVMRVRRLKITATKLVFVFALTLLLYLFLHGLMFLIYTLTVFHAYTHIPFEIMVHMIIIIFYYTLLAVVLVRFIGGLPSVMLFVLMIVISETLSGYPYVLSELGAGLYLYHTFFPSLHFQADLRVLSVLSWPVFISLSITFCIMLLSKDHLKNFL